MVTRNNFPYAIAFEQHEAQNRVEMQPVQERGLRWLGNLDTLIQRERERLKLEFQDATTPPAVTPGTGPIPADVLPPSITIQLPGGGGGSGGGGSMTDARQFVTINGGFSGGCK